MTSCRARANGRSRILAMTHREIEERAALPDQGILGEAEFGAKEGQKLGV